MKGGSEIGGILAMGFDKKRAEGRDESDRPKKLQLNPFNTNAYVQVKANRFDFCFFLFVAWIKC